MGQPKKDNTKRDMAVLKTICTILARGEIPSVRDVAAESGYTKPSTYISFKSLLEHGYLSTAASQEQKGGKATYLPPFVVTVMSDAAKELLANME